MAEEQEQQPQPSETLDQEALDRMFGNAAENDDADQLEAMLDTLEDPSDAEAAETPAEETDLDGMEAMLDQMESPEEAEESEVSDLNDMLYQATLADAQGDTEDGVDEETTDEGEEDLAAMMDEVAEADEEESLDLDAIVEDTDNADGEEGDLAAMMSEESEETVDLDALVEDTEEDSDEDLASLMEDITDEEAGEETLDLEAIVEDDEDAQAAEDLVALMDEEAESDLDLGELVEDATEEDAPDTVPEEAVEEEDLNLDALVEENDETLDIDALVEDTEEIAAEETSEEDELASMMEDMVEEEAVENEATDEDAQAEEDLAALMGEETEVAAEEELNLEALVEDAPTEDATEDLDLDALVEETDSEEDMASLMEEATEEETPAEDDLNLEDLTEETEETAQDLEADLDLDALVEDTDAETNSLEDVDALLEDAESPEGEENMASLMEEATEEADLDLDALVEDAEPTEGTEDVADLDLDALVEDTESAEDTEEIEDLDLDALVDDVESVEEATNDEDLDLDALVETDAETDLDSLDDIDTLLETEESAENLEEDLDLDALVDDAEPAPEDDLDLDSLVTDDEAAAEDLDDVDALLDDIDADDAVEEPAAEDDLDDLLGDLDVGVEDEVAQILTTPSEDVEDTDSILDEFATVQDSIPSELDETGGQGGSVMIVDSNADNRSVFKDALSDGDYTFTEQDTSADIMAALGEQEIDLVVINLDDDSGGAQELVEQIVSSLELPSIPVIVNSTDNDQIEIALRAGAADYLTLPLDVMDVEFQLPQKVANQIKLKRAERILAGADSGIAELDDTPTVPEVDLDTLDDGLTLDDDLGLDEEVILDDDLDLDTLDDGLGLGTSEDDLLLDDDLDLDTLDDDLGLDNEVILDDDLSLEEELDLDDDLNLDSLELDDEPSPDELLVGSGKGKDPLVPISDQQKILRNRQVERDDVSRLPLFVAIALFLAAGAGLIYNYADDLMKLVSQKDSQVAQTPTLQKPLPKVAVPAVPKQNFATSRNTPQRQPATQPDNTFQRQAEVLKGRIRQNVADLEASGSSWWSPWRVMRASGGSVSGLVNRRSVDEILEVFGVDTQAIERGLNSERTLDYLANVGYDLRGKDVEDLTGREAFELLSARQIRDSNQIIDILSDLTDRLADDRTTQAEHKERERRKQRKGHAVLSKPEIAPTLSISIDYVAEQVAPKQIVVPALAEARGSPSHQRAHLQKERLWLG